jgi:CDP-diacylglycerol---serine O-phosphatidyltransferase
MRSHIPNFITCLNLISGSLAIVFLLQGDLTTCTLLVGASLVFDFLDGFAARALKAQSPIGKELDSLADMVTFGLVPGLIMHRLLLNSVPLVLFEDSWWYRPVSYTPLIITAFSALRLAKFNLDTRQTDSFLGLPTPACTIFVAGLALAMEHDRFHITPLVNNTWILIGFSLILSWFLISEVPLIALKFKSFSLKNNKTQYLLLIGSALMLILMGVTGIPLIIVLYITLSLSKSGSDPKTS